MNRISGKSRSSISPSPLSSFRFATTGVDTTCADAPNGAGAADFAALSPPQWNSRLGSTSLKSAGGSVQVGAAPVPTHAPASHSVNSGQSQSSSQVQPVAPLASVVHSL